MRPALSKSGLKLAKDKASLVYNDYLTLTGIPAARKTPGQSPRLSKEPAPSVSMAVRRVMGDFMGEDGVGMG